MNIDISNKVVVITGASRGIGRELAKTFASEKAKVIINYFHSDIEAQSLYHEILQYNDACMLIKADISNPDDVIEMYKKIINRYGTIDVLINNAGVCVDNAINSMSVEQWKTVIDINLTGVFLSCREYSKIMMHQFSGKIINIASLKGQEGSAEQVNYCASKAGVLGLTKTLAKELAKYNISVNAVCPGFIVTDLNRYCEKKKVNAENNSLLDISSSLYDLVSFVILMASNRFSGVSGRVFNIDSRIK